MSLILNEEQIMLKNSAHEFFGDQMPVSSLRELRDKGDKNGFDPAHWAAMAEMGWAGILVPEACGGSDFGYLGMGQVLEESGRTLAASPLFATALIGAPLMATAGNAEQQQKVLSAVASGDCLLALAIDESPRHEPLGSQLTAVKNGDGFELQGQKQFVLDGHVADYLIVLARTSGRTGDPAGLSMFLVDRNISGLAISPTLMVDSRYASKLTFDKVRVSGDALIGELDDAWPTLERVLDGARAGIAAEMLGAGQEAFERTLAYLKMRQQFGAPIGSFQALKHRAALMFCELELTRSAVLAALSALDKGAENVAELASLAKAKACDMLELVSNEAVQMHGGIGMTDAEEIGFFLKRARVQQQVFGDAGFHRDRYATLPGF